MIRKLLALILVIGILVSAGTVAVGGSGDDENGTKDGFLDPFTLSTIDTIDVGTLSGPPSLIRIPFRPSLRSPYRPPLILD